MKTNRVFKRYSSTKLASEQRVVSEQLFALVFRRRELQTPRIGHFWEECIGRRKWHGARTVPTRRALRNGHWCFCDSRIDVLRAVGRFLFLGRVRLQSSQQESQSTPLLQYVTDTTEMIHRDSAFEANRFKFLNDINYFVFISYDWRYK